MCAEVWGCGLKVDTLWKDTTWVYATFGFHTILEQPKVLICAMIGYHRIPTTWVDATFGVHNILEQPKCAELCHDCVNHFELSTSATFGILVIAAIRLAKCATWATFDNIFRFLFHTVSQSVCTREWADLVLGLLAPKKKLQKGTASRNNVGECGAHRAVICLHVPWRMWVTFVTQILVRFPI